MNKFKAGDKVKIVKCSGEDAWYRHHIGYEYTIGDNPTTLVERKYWYIVEHPERTIFGNDIELVTISLEKGIELHMKNTENTITTEDAILHLRGLLDYCVDSQIVIQVNSIMVNASDKTFIAETAESLEKICNAVNFLATQELD